MGRYRLSLRACSEHLVPGKLNLQAWPAEAPLFPCATTPMGGQAFTEQGAWQSFTLNFDVELGKTVVVGLVNREWSPIKDGVIKIEKASITVEKLPLPVSIAWARTAKIRYHHHERGELQAHLSNATAQSQRVSVTPILIDDDNVRLPGHALSVTIPARTTLAVSAPFTFGTADGGYEVVAVLTQRGKLLDEHSGDVFAVSDNPWQFDIDIASGLTNQGPPAFPLGIKGFKEQVLGNGMNTRS